MDGTVAQIISMTAYANAYLSGKEPFSYNLSNSSAQCCEKIQYVDLVKKLYRYSEKMIARNPDEWVKFLRDSGVKSLWLHYVPSQNADLKDRYSAAFAGGGGRWLIEASYEECSDYWEARWEIGNKDAKDNRIWIVTYGRISRNDIKRQFKPDSIGTISKKLEERLKEIKVFADRHDLGFFGKCFEKSLECLKSPDPLEYFFHKDLVPDSFQNLESLRILCASQMAWVFGGMGSWNDLGFAGEEQEIYEKVSDDLYMIICEAIPAAVNSFMQG